jgi:Tfp pilus assembly protein PilO
MLMTRLKLKPFWTKRSYYLPLIIGVVVNGLVYVALTYRLATKQDRLARQHASLVETVDTRALELAELDSERQRLVRNHETANTFWSDVVQPRDPGLTEAWAELDRLADQAGVLRGRMSFDYNELDVGLEQVSASMPLEGSYFNLVQFINRLERSPRFFLVREIGLRRSTLDDGVIGLRCNVTFFLKNNENDAGEDS